MKKIIVLTLMLLVSSYNYSQVLDDLKKTSHYTYIFKLSEKEANLLYTKGIEQLKDTFFHTLKDSFLTEEKYKGILQNGYYLTRIIHEISFIQMRGVETRRNTFVFRGFCNEADG